MAVGEMPVDEMSRAIFCFDSLEPFTTVIYSPVVSNVNLRPG